MALNWIDVNRFDFRCLLLMEHFQLKYLMTACDGEAARHLGIALRGHPDVAWYISHRVPETADRIMRLTADAPDAAANELRASEIAVMGWCEDFVIYTQPELMATHCDFIHGWHEERLHELVDLTGLRVLDIGSGSGRLAFAAARIAREVYAVEPVETLRRFLQEEATRRGIANLHVADGFCDSLPYPDDTFDVVLSGHVVGDDYDAEIAEMTRVCRDGGWILDIPGDQRHDLHPKQELISRGFECMPYAGSFGAQVCRYRRQVRK